MTVALSALPAWLGVISAALGSVYIRDAASDERCYVATKLSDDGVTGAGRYMKIAGILNVFPVTLKSRNRSDRNHGLTIHVCRGEMQICEALGFICVQT